MKAGVRGKARSTTSSRTHGRSRSEYPIAATGRTHKDGRRPRVGIFIQPPGSTEPYRTHLRVNLRFLKVIEQANKYYATLSEIDGSRGQVDKANKFLRKALRAIDLGDKFDSVAPKGDFVHKTQRYMAPAFLWQGHSAAETTGISAEGFIFQGEVITQGSNHFGVALGGHFRFDNREPKVGASVPNTMTPKGGQKPYGGMRGGADPAPKRASLEALKDGYNIHWTTPADEWARLIEDAQLRIHDLPDNIDDLEPKQPLMYPSNDMGEDLRSKHVHDFRQVLNELQPIVEEIKGARTTRVRLVEILKDVSSRIDTARIDSQLFITSFIRKEIYAKARFNIGTRQNGNEEFRGALETVFEWRALYILRLWVLNRLLRRTNEPEYNITNLLQAEISYRFMLRAHEKAWSEYDLFRFYHWINSREAGAVVQARVGLRRELDRYWKEEISGIREANRPQGKVPKAPPTTQKTPEPTEAELPDPPNPVLKRERSKNEYKPVDAVMVSIETLQNLVNAYRDSLGPLIAETASLVPRTTAAIRHTINIAARNHVIFQLENIIENLNANQGKVGGWMSNIINNIPSLDGLLPPGYENLMFPPAPPQNDVIEHPSPVPGDHTDSDPPEPPVGDGNSDNRTGKGNTDDGNTGDDNTGDDPGGDLNLNELIDRDGFQRWYDSQPSPTQRLGYEDLEERWNQIIDRRVAQMTGKSSGPTLPPIPNPLPSALDLIIPENYVPRRKERVFEGDFGAGVQSWAWADILYAMTWKEFYDNLPDDEKGDLAGSIESYSRLIEAAKRVRGNTIWFQPGAQPQPRGWSVRDVLKRSFDDYYNELPARAKRSVERSRRDWKRVRRNAQDVVGGAPRPSTRPSTVSPPRPSVRPPPRPSTLPPPRPSTRRRTIPQPSPSTRPPAPPSVRPRPSPSTRRLTIPPPSRSTRPSSRLSSDPKLNTNTPTPSTHSRGAATTPTQIRTDGSKGSKSTGNPPGVPTTQKTSK
ncbi:uncharacterized protein GGS25DRAFT_470574 [Hypoxylon fragiforme]|uniref:uncharacterized protein n=1 Tax=Hypoxylon fragiforme TaxID=63214 RepID=UPI0020C70B7C|nr:uncharacterized protein GGS25DRAFT_470574 [Hypoxylon fragiforme]KAI2614163.1 hypothetical protein GGS25DRAFT_470574 [Hypoxylon fragiforme]